MPNQRTYLDIGGVFPMDAPAASTLPLTNRQEATVIAALKLWRMLLRQEVDLSGPIERIKALTNAASDFDLHEPLTPEEVTQLLADNFREVA